MSLLANPDLLRTKTYIPSTIPMLELASFTQALHKARNGLGRTQGNYSQRRFNALEHEAISMTFDGVSCVSFSSIWKRDWYPGGTVRILNRFWKDPSYRRRKPVKEVANFVLDAIQQQVEFCKQSGYDFLFISREYNNGRYMRFLCEEINKNSKGQWFAPEGLFLVCDNPHVLPCWQHLIFLDLRESDRNVPFLRFPRWSSGSRITKAALMARLTEVNVNPNSSSGGSAY